MHTRGRWYLVAWDIHCDDWRTFRVDRMGLRARTGPGFTRRSDPGGDLRQYVERGLGSATWRYRARVKVHAPATDVVARVPPAVIIESIDEQTCFANVGSDSAHELAMWLALLDADFDASDDQALAEELRALADRFTRAAG